MIHDDFNVLFNFHLVDCVRVPRATAAAVELDATLFSTMTIMQQMNPFSRINNKWICV